MSKLTRWTPALDPGPFDFRAAGDGGGPEAIVYLPDNGRGDFTPSRDVVVYRIGDRPEEMEA